MAAPKHVYEVFVQATPSQVWLAITEPEFTERYFHHTSFESDLIPGAKHRYLLPDGKPAVEGVIEEVEAEYRLLMTWQILYDSAMADEPPSRVEWVLRPANDQATVTRVTLRHFDLGASPLSSNNVALGWYGVLHSMKTLLETGEPLGEIAIAHADQDDPGPHHLAAGAANGAAWELLGKDTLSPTETDDLIERAYAAAYHWRRAVDADAPNHARAAWLLARCHTVAGHVDAAIHHARRCQELTATAVGVADFDQAYAHEALARALALTGQTTEARTEFSLAKAVNVGDSEDRALVEADLSDGPWFGLFVE